MGGLLYNVLQKAVIPEYTSWLHTAGTMVVALLIYWFIGGTRLHKSKHPPGPSSLPLWGNLSLRSNNSLYRKCKEYCKIYGPVFRVKTATANIVILNDWALIRQFYCAEDERSKPRQTIFYEVTQGTMGMANLNGEAWTENRNFGLRALRDLGFGKTPMEENIKEELLNLINKIEGAKERAVPVFEFILSSTLNVTSLFLFGNKCVLNDPKRGNLVKHVEKFSELLHFDSIIECKPQWLSRLEASLPFTRTGAMRRTRQVLLDYIRDRIKEHEDTIEPDFNRDFIDGYLRMVKKHQHDPNSAFHERHLLGNTAELFLGAASNAPSLIHWLLLVCAQNPDTVQARIQKEVDDVVGRHRQPTWEDRKAMPFTMASVLEMTRWKVMIPIGMPRGVQEDTSIGKYFIPKGTMVLANVMGVHRDPELWANPDDFDPTRFLTADGTELSKKPEYHIAFSLGKRNCPGEMLGNVQMFLYLATLLQKFSVLPVEGRPLPDLGCLTTTCSHPSVKELRFVSRQ
ncbi:cytochrome P450 2H2-like isoform X1 [Ixodes scapularis]|uniref:cytochrome P450 2H2-like isoform X1 n=2 Tax=Ixodes scapularis TaxID=6945 RepID=UPI001A9EC2A2|nr:cytochrome P450 2H2-like isoform X1 [Ixodes scapularis]